MNDLPTPFVRIHVMKTFAILCLSLMAALSTQAPAADTPAAAPSGKTETAIIGGGCFWCVEAQYLMVKGVKKVVSGYAGGTKDNPTYEEVCEGTTGHAEVIQIDFDPAVVSYKEIIELFWDAHDPTSVTKEDMYKHGKFLPKGTAYQGNDYGSRYPLRHLHHHRRAAQNRPGVQDRRAEKLQGPHRHRNHPPEEVLPRRGLPSKFPGPQSEPRLCPWGGDAESREVQAHPGGERQDQARGEVRTGKAA